MKRLLFVVACLLVAPRLVAQTLPTPDELATQEAALETVSAAKLAKLAAIRAEIAQYRIDTDAVTAATAAIVQTASDLATATAALQAAQAANALAQTAATTAIAAKGLAAQKVTTEVAQIQADIQAASTMSQVLPLVQPGSLVYLGACRLPAGFDYAGPGPAWGRSSLFLFGDATIPGGPSLFEVTCAPKIAAAVSGLPFVSVKSSAPAPFNPAAVGGSSGMAGILVSANGRLVADAVVGYDGNNQQIVSHFAAGGLGPVQVGPTRTAGYVAGAMANIPPALQASLGGPALTGQCCLSVISRTNFGAGVSVFDPEQIGVVSPVPASVLLGQPTGHTTISIWANTVGIGGSVVYDASSAVRGIVIPEGSRSVLFFGRQGTGKMCYGPGNADPTKAGTFDPSDPVDPICWDPANGSKGQHSYPYVVQVWAYDANELAAVRAGTKSPWEPAPYKIWPLSLPFTTSHFRLIDVLGATIDNAQHRLYVSVAFQDGDRPLLHAFQVNP